MKIVLYFLSFVCTHHITSRNTMLIVVVLSSLLFSNCNSNQNNVTTSPQSQDSYTVISFEGDELPAIGMFNQGLFNYPDWASFPWNCSVVVRCKEVNNAGLPTDAEANILNEFEDSLCTKIVGDKIQPNALYFGRLNWNSTRELIWKVKDPEPVAGYLQSVIDDKSAIREIDFKIEYDKEWKMTQLYSDAINQNKP